MGFTYIVSFSHPAGLRVLNEGLRRAIDEANAYNTSINKNAVDKLQKICENSLKNLSDIIVPFRTQIPISKDCLGLIETAGAIINGDPKGKYNDKSFVWAEPDEMITLFSHCRTVYEEYLNLNKGNDENTRILSEDESKYFDRLVNRVKAEIQNGGKETDIILELVNMDHGKFRDRIQLYDIYKRAEWQITRFERDARVSNVSALSLTEAGMAEQFVDEFQDQIKFVHELGIWRAWSGILWVDDPAKTVVTKMLKERIALLRDRYMNNTHDEGVKSAYNKTFKSLLTKNHINAILDLASRDERVISYTHHYDRDPFLINFRNGTYDCQTGRLREHDPEDLITHMAGQGYDPETGTEYVVNFDPEAVAPKWQRCMEEWFPEDSATVRAMQVWLGYSLTGLTSEDSLVTWHGADGRNGKGVCKDLALAVLGSYGAVADPNTFMRRREGIKGGPRGDLKALIGKRAIFVSETNEEDVLDEAFVKNWTGRDILSFRAPYGRDTVDMRPQGKLTIQTNKLARITAADSIWDRVNVVPWSVYIELEKRNKNLRSELFKELPGIINWFLEGYQTYREAGRLIESEKMREAKIKYKVAMNPIADFIDACCVLARDIEPELRERIRIQRTELLGEYKAWAQDEMFGKQDLLSRNAFYDAVRKYYKREIREKDANGIREFEGITTKVDYANKKSFPGILAKPKEGA